MMYHERFIVVVKHNGRILREHLDGGQSTPGTGTEKESTVTLPFGSEYSLLLKNLDSRKASVQVFIDGQDVLSGKSLIVESGQETDLERFVESMDEGNKFKFIQKTEQIIKHRGDRIDDGFIRIVVTYEKQVVQKKIVTTIEHWHNHHYDWHYPHRHHHWSTPTIYYSNCGGITGDGSSKGTLRGQSDFQCFNSSNDSIDASEYGTVDVNCTLDVDPNQDEGITVKGSKSQQQFRHGYIGELEESSSVIIIRLCGTKENGTIVVESITTKTKIQCSTCGKKSKSNIKFCPNCGTCLV